jgi:peptidylprolyl isomerase/FKBP-type peptidyl-prolyl cis-trans isomerase FkpA
MKKEEIFLGGAVVVFAAVAIAAFRPNFINKRSDTDGDSTGVEVMSAGELVVEDIALGEGRAVQAGDTISIHYHGTLTDGTVFDSSLERGTPFETQIGVGQVIEGWDKGVVGMKIGGKRRLTIPPDMAYGSRSVGSIPANSTLIFEVELIDILTP